MTDPWRLVCPQGLAIDAVHLDGTDTTPAPEAAEAGPNAQLVQFGADPPS